MGFQGRQEIGRKRCISGGFLVCPSGTVVLYSKQGRGNTQYPEGVEIRPWFDQGWLHWWGAGQGHHWGGHQGGRFNKTLLLQRFYAFS